MIKLRHLAFFGLWLAAMPARADVISYLRFEEGSSWYTEDETGLMNGALVGFATDLSAGSGDSGPEGWSTSVALSVIPLTGESNSGSLHYAGGGAYVNISNANNLELGTSFTIEFFFLADEEPIGASPIFSLNPGSGLGLILTPSLDFGLGFQSYVTYAPSGIEVGQWYHYALVKEPGEYSIYIDGVLVYNSSLPSGTDGPYSFFGTDISGDRKIGYGFRGYIDEFRISDEALTSDQFLIVPEPSTLVLISLGLLGVCGRRFAKRRTAGW